MNEGHSRQNIWLRKKGKKKKEKHKKKKRKKKVQTWGTTATGPKFMIDFID